METPKSLYIQTTAELQLRFFGDEVAVFDVGSAQTHLLNPSGAQVLQAIVSGVTAQADLETVLADSMPQCSSAELEGALEVYLHNFDQQGLISLSSASESL